MLLELNVLYVKQHEKLELNAILISSPNCMESVSGSTPKHKTTQLK